MKLNSLPVAATFLLASLGPTAAAEFQFWYGNTGAAETAIQNACAAFNDSQTEHKITCVGQGSYDTAMQKAIAAVRAKQHPVLIQFFDAGTLDLMLSGAVEPVAQALPDVDWSNYVTGAKSYYETSKGQLYSQPYNASTVVFYGNKEVMAKGGIDAPPQTYEALVEALRKLKTAGVECPYVTDGHPWRVLEQVAARHGAPIASRSNGYDGLDAEYQINQGLPAQHLTNLAAWHDEGLVKLDPETRAGTFSDAFNAGECAFMEASTANYSAAYKALGDKVLVGMAPVYEGTERKNTFVGGGSLWIMKGHDPEAVAAAGEFLNFVRQPEQQINLIREAAFVPVTNDVMTVMRDQNLLTDPAFGSIEAGMESLNQPGNENSRGIRLGFYVQFRDIFKEETQRAFSGEQTMQAALDNAKTRGDELLRRFQQTYSGVELP
ncbi:extracellular solute-binding protein [Paracoccus sp. S1E-3]|uniref:extracellular solute-binding protein n=1 Tax=Paracoccus sp. S1E-3 TaxID=2756130 RepID=UPI0015EFCEE5|nr:extracellular solute-binding protein [Paracoccus sp. S1E-3]MBA4489368.1 extracellular solute-binding protein [Paracoccus sp. S1E-3]